MARGHSYPEDLRDRLVSAAAERLVLATPEHLNLRELAASQQTSTNAIYTIFGGKQALIDAVIAQANDTFLARQRAALGDGPSLAGLVRLGVEYRTWALEHPVLYMLMFGHCGAGPVANVAAGTMGPLITMVSGLIGRGVLRDLPVETVCRAFWAATHGFVLIEMSEGADPAEPAAAARFADFQQIFLRGLLTDEARAEVGSAE